MDENGEQTYLVTQIRQVRVSARSAAEAREKVEGVIFVRPNHDRQIRKDFQQTSLTVEKVK